jgi:ABC-type lipoprotein export system ATPase subunit
LKIKRQPGAQKEILHGVTGRVMPGETLAIMGPSGSGKTTLLNILGGRGTHGVKGQITYNDIKYNKALKRRLDFCDPTSYLELFEAFINVVSYKNHHFEAFSKFKKCPC